MIGFHTWYRRQGITYLAIRLAEIAESKGKHTSLLSFGYHDPYVHDHWDKRALNSNKLSFSNWSSQCSVVVWPEFIKPVCVQEAKRNKSKCILIPMWEQLKEEQLVELNNYDSIVCVSKALQALLKEKFALTNTKYIPFDIGLISKTLYQPSDKIRLFYPVAGPQTRRQAKILLPILEYLLNKYSYLTITITYLRRWPLESFHLLKQLQERFNSTRLGVYRDLSYQEHIQLYGMHDLTLWPTVREGLGLIGLESLSQGTPVLAYDVPPMSEYLDHAYNSWLLPCKIAHSGLGVPEAIPDSDILQKELEYLIHDKQTLETLRLGACDRQPTKTVECYHGWGEIFGC